MIYMYAHVVKWACLESMHEIVITISPADVNKDSQLPSKVSNPDLGVQSSNLK